MIKNITYTVKRIETGYLIEYYFEGAYIVRAFDNWADTLKFLKDNPPKTLEAIATTEYVEIE